MKYCLCEAPIRDHDRRGFIPNHVAGRGGGWHKPRKDRDCHSMRRPLVSMQFERILSDLIADVQLIGVDDSLAEGRRSEDSDGAV